MKIGHFYFNRYLNHLKVLREKKYFFTKVNLDYLILYSRPRY